MRKKFNETRVGSFLKDKAPKVLDTVGDLLPSNGVFGVVKNLISSSEELTPKDKEFAIKKLEEDVKAYQIEVNDRDSARQREIKMSENKSIDLLFYLTGLIGLGVFCFIVYAIVYLQVPEENKEIWIHLIGITEGVVLSIFGYYFGSSIKRNVHP